MKSIRVVRNGLSLLGMLALTAGLRAAAQAADTPAGASSRRDVPIQPGCVLTVTVAEEAGLSGTFPVDAAGAIRFRLADDQGRHSQVWSVKVQGLTVAEAREAIRSSLKRYLVMPQVAVALIRAPRLRIEVSGEADTMGALDLPLESRLSDALAACDYKPTADLAHIRIVRITKPSGANHLGAIHLGANPSEPRTIPVDFTAIGGKENDDPLLEAGDRIVLPRLPGPSVSSAPMIVRITGEVEHEGGFPISSGMLVRDVFERAGGLKDTADHGRIVLARTNGRYYALDADRVLQGDPIHNLPLQDGDLLVVGKRDQSLRFAILGEVAQPRTLDWSPNVPVRLTAALEQAGGLTRNGDRHKGLLRRNFLRDPAETQDIPFDLDQIKKGREPDWEIQAGDAIVIPPRIHRPSPFQQLLPLLFRFLPLGL